MKIQRLQHHHIHIVYNIITYHLKSHEIIETR